MYSLNGGKNKSQISHIIAWIEEQATPLPNSLSIFHSLAKRNQMSTTPFLPIHTSTPHAHTQKPQKLVMHLTWITNNLSTSWTTKEIHPSPSTHDLYYKFLTKTHTPLHYTSINKYIHIIYYVLCMKVKKKTKRTTTYYIFKIQ